MTTVSLDSGAAAQPASVAGPQAAQRSRVESVDILRGIVMIIMAIDHVRDFMGPQVPFFGIDVQKVGAPLFLTRWITHFCAPVFVFLAGTGAHLQAARGKSKAELSRFLLTRGLWLALLEMTIIRFGWSFDPFYHFTGIGVIWAIGWSMVALAGLVWLPRKAIAVLGLLLVFGHHLLDGIKAASFGSLGFLWSIFHAPGRYEPVSGHYVFVVYPLIPWVGVMALGYSLGSILEGSVEERRARLFRLGALATALFFLVRGSNVYGDPLPWSSQGSVLYTALSFLNCTKYPPSLSYLLMTLGPALLVLSALEGREVWGKGVWLAFGRAPLFYYLLHLYLIHIAVIALFIGAYGLESVKTRIGQMPENMLFGLPAVYAMTLAVVVVLYPLCRRFAEYKRRRKDLVWLSYL